MDGRRVMFGQVIRVEAGRVEPLYLQQPLAVDAVQAQSRHRLDMVEDAESKCHGASSLIWLWGCPDARSINLIDRWQSEKVLTLVYTRLLLSLVTRPSSLVPAVVDASVGQGNHAARNPD